jgi:hypothetical protein
MQEFASSRCVALSLLRSSLAQLKAPTLAPAEIAEEDVPYLKSSRQSSCTLADSATQVQGRSCDPSHRFFRPGRVRIVFENLLCRRTTALPWSDSVIYGGFVTCVIVT